MWGTGERTAQGGVHRAVVNSNNNSPLSRRGGGVEYCYSVVGLARLVISDPSIYVDKFKETESRDFGNGWGPCIWS